LPSPSFLSLDGARIELELPMDKPFHLMTPAERTALRIAQNRAIAEKVGEPKLKKPPQSSTADFVRATPDEHAKLGTVIRKTQR
jgi:hypothetical protein